MIHHIPLAAIDETALTRDRTTLDEAALLELRLSIARSGLRMPIELFPLPEPHDASTPLRYGLISGYRRLMAVRALHELTRQERYATIPALIREPATPAAALTEMIEENEIRESLSPWERGRIALLARDQGLFGTIEDAVDRLYPSADRTKKGRIRSFARVVEALDGVLTDPETLSATQVFRLANAVRDGQADLIATALEESRLDDAGSQWRLIEPILAEAETHRAESAPARPDRPRRILKPRRGLTIRREATTDGYILRFTGPEATGMLMDSVMNEIERLFSPG